LLKIQDQGKSDLKFTFKVSNFHIDISGTQRQKVKTAAQLLSRTVSKAIQYYGNNNETLPSNLVNNKILNNCIPCEVIECLIRTRLYIHF